MRACVLEERRKRPLRRAHRRTNELRDRDREQVEARLRGECSHQHRLAGAGRAVEQQPARAAEAEPRAELRRGERPLHELLQARLGGEGRLRQRRRGATGPHDRHALLHRRRRRLCASESAHVPPASASQRLARRAQAKQRGGLHQPGSGPPLLLRHRDERSTLPNAPLPRPLLWPLLAVRRRPLQREQSRLLADCGQVGRYEPVERTGQIRGEGRRRRRQPGGGGCGGERPRAAKPDWRRYGELQGAARTHLRQTRESPLRRAARSGRRFEPAVSPAHARRAQTPR